MFERTTPRLFEHGPSPASRLMVCAALAVFLMVADSRFHVVRPVREAIATAIYPLQWLMLQPVLLHRHARQYMAQAKTMQQQEAEVQTQVLALAQTAHEAQFLKMENTQLRALLGLRERVASVTLTAEIIYETPDPYTNRLTINKGRSDGVQEGAPVLDAHGVLGQVTRVYLHSSEVRLVSDRQHAVPVMNTRTGLRMLAFGEAVARPSGGMEVRYVPVGTDMQQGDLLVTSGIDGYYPAGLPVGVVAQVDAQHDAPFLRIAVQPSAQVSRVRHVLVVTPTGPSPEHEETDAEDTATGPAARKVGAP